MIMDNDVYLKHIYAEVIKHYRDANCLLSETATNEELDPMSVKKVARLISTNETLIEICEMELKKINKLLS